MKTQIPVPPLTSPRPMTELERQQLLSAITSRRKFLELPSVQLGNTLLKKQSEDQDGQSSTAAIPKKGFPWRTWLAMPARHYLRRARACSVRLSLFLARRLLMRKVRQLLSRG